MTYLTSRTPSEQEQKYFNSKNLKSPFELSGSLIHTVGYTLSRASGLPSMWCYLCRIAPREKETGNEATLRSRGPTRAQKRYRTCRRNVALETSQKCRPKLWGSRTQKFFLSQRGTQCRLKCIDAYLMKFIRLKRENFLFGCFCSSKRLGSLLFYILSSFFQNHFLQFLPWIGGMKSGIWCQ